MNLENRLKSFAWRAGLYVLIAVAGYIGNIADIREIDFYKLATIFIVTLFIYVGNEGTKILNS